MIMLLYCPCPAPVLPPPPAPVPLPPGLSVWGLWLSCICHKPAALVHLWPQGYLCLMGVCLFWDPCGRSPASLEKAPLTRVGERYRRLSKPHLSPLCMCPRVPVGTAKHMTKSHTSDGKQLLLPRKTKQWMFTFNSNGARLGTSPTYPTLQHPSTFQRLICFLHTS